MDREILVQLTTDLYHLTLLFPKKEPLRYKIRELADDILANHLRLNFASGSQQGITLDILQDLEVLETFFAVAKEQNWVSPENLLNISKRYASLKDKLEGITKSQQEAVFETITAEAAGDFNGSAKNIRRRDRILEILKEKGKAQVWELKEIFPQVSKRTLRRDFERLLGQGLVQRIGERNQTFYQVAGTAVI
jgi:hypothetical protein